MLGSVAPLYEAPPDLNPANASVCLANDGYVVGGLIVNDKDGAAGMRVIFMKKAPTGPDTRDCCMSPWLGYTDEGTQHTPAGKGERVIGTFGRQGMNMDAIGFVVEPVSGAAPADPSAHPPQ